jgi:small subunit ribosomal protein S5
MARERQQRDNRPQEEKQFDERIIQIDRVARVVKGGRRFRFRALVAVGDNKGRAGVGSAKGADVTAAVTKATEVAKRNMITLPIHRGTIDHEIIAKVGGTKIMLKPAAPGTGLIAGGVVRTVLEVGGVHNILSKSFGSSNKLNAAYATIEALKAIVPREHWLTLKVNPTKKAATKKEVPAEAKPAKAETAPAKPKATAAKTKKAE